MKEEQVFHQAIGAHLAPPERIYQNIVKASRRRRPGLRRAFLAAAACIALLLLATVCIPEARAMVMSWLRPAVDPAAYIATPSEERAGVPALEAAIQAPEARDVAVEITEAADETWRAWAEALTVEVQELLYDGSALHISASLRGNLHDFLRPISEYIREETESGVTFSLPDDMVICGAALTLNGIEVRDYTTTLNNINDPEEIEACLARGSIPFTLTFLPQESLAGPQEAELTLLFADAASVRQLEGVPGEAFPTRAALRFTGLAFDADASRTQDIPVREGASVALTGEALIFSGEESPENGRAMVGNDRLSLEGGSLSAPRIRQKLTGTEIVFLLTLPEGWTERQCGMFASRISVEFLVNGENQGGFGSAYTGIRYSLDEAEAATLGVEGGDFHQVLFAVETGLMAEDWERIDRLEVLLCADELISYNRVPLPADGRATADYQEDGWQEETELRRFEGCLLRLK